jgi:hypothetical protein
MPREVILSIRGKSVNLEHFDVAIVQCIVLNVRKDCKLLCTMKALNEFPITDYESLSTGVAQHSLSNNAISRKLYHIKKPLLQLLTYTFSLLQSIPKVPILLIRQIQELLPSRLD